MNLPCQLFFQHGVNSLERRTRWSDSVTTPANLFAQIPHVLTDELVSTLLDAQDVRIERIVSQGHASPEGFWYDQAQHEWVVVLRGAARLRVENQPPVEMGPGDFINIPAHTRHRVEWTTPDEPMLWLAVYYGDPR